MARKHFDFISSAVCFVLAISNIPGVVNDSASTFTHYLCVVAVVACSFNSGVCFATGLLRHMGIMK